MSSQCCFGDRLTDETGEYEVINPNVGCA